MERFGQDVVVTRLLLVNDFLDFLADGNHGIKETIRIQPCFSDAVGLTIKVLANGPRHGRLWKP
jgi:hypothetical protein